MEKDLLKLEEEIKNYINKYNIKEFRVDIMELYNKKKVDIIVK